ncbi:hypothetical protein [Nibrella saemangeumensis]|uniref:hypothetical protein n=1 Tax=Nibrella saemangeumensis TaxID=1084526 RepID=UPI0031E60850
MKLILVVMCIGLSTTWVTAQTFRSRGTIVIVQEWERSPAADRSTSFITTRSSLVIISADSLTTTPIRPLHRIYPELLPAPKKNRAIEQEDEAIDFLEETELSSIFSMFPSGKPVNSALWKAPRPKKPF